MYLYLLIEFALNKFNKSHFIDIIEIVHNSYSYLTNSYKDIGNFGTLPKHVNHSTN